MHLRTRMSLAIAACIAAGSGPLLAQGLEEVVVTAQKREQSLQDAPISIAAFDASDLEQKGVANLDDLGTSVPNVKITRSPSNTSAATIAIRGSVTINPAVTWEPTVGIYLDGVFIGKNVGAIFDVAELERVEMLRGPQGTLYGKNTVGGAVNLITTKPSGELGGKVRVGAGNYDLRTVYATIDTPSLDLGGAGQVMAKFTASYRNRDGLYDNVADPFGNPLANEPLVNELNDIDNRTGRYDILWDASDRLQLRYTWDYSDLDLKPAKNQLTYLDPADPFGINPLLAPYVTADNENRDTVSLDKAAFERSKSISRSLFAEYNIGEIGVLGDVTFKYIGNDRTLSWDDSIDIDGSPVDLFASSRFIDYDQASHEIQMVGTTERTNYVLGLYYFEEQADVFNPISFFRGFGSPTQNNEYGFDNDSVAAFGQVEWRPGAAMFQDRLSLALGVRWTEETKDTYISHPDDIDPVTGTPIPFAGTAEKSFSNTSPTFVAAWEVSDDVNVYGKIAQGWKAGGFNGEAPFAQAFFTPYDAEEITSYELGVKSRWLDNRLQLNGAVFQNESEDMQMSIFIAGNSAASVVQNAGEATIRGFELEMIALPMPDLELSASYGYLDAEYGEFIEGGVDVKDQKDFPYTPNHSAALAAEYTVYSGAWGELTGRLDYEYVDRYVPYVEPTQNATSSVDPYQLLNGRLTLANIPVADGQSLKVALWGENLLDKEYRINTIPFGLWTASFYGDPRTYGIEASYEF
ncbi:TonB-dependent receptor [Kineobactrum sediminis]|uniref:TonB-dependent receptor n=1 Tax=Kineobactrum sediminis TaxID=1905677 RepID=A0A2N5Y1T5_9GAMM|nr:TonB-dependent receptor [Kineobactrum sediminis]PLW82356.1 TonB-dependent receptor [Kineobactrum sediminis]